MVNRPLTLDGNIGISLIANSTIAKNKFVYLRSDGKVDIADQSDDAKMPVFGITEAAIPAGENVGVLRQGKVQDDSWSFTPGGKIFVNNSGGPTQTGPTTGNSQVVGFASASDEIYIEISDNVKLSF